MQLYSISIFTLVFLSASLLKNGHTQPQGCLTGRYATFGKFKEFSIQRDIEYRKAIGRDGQITSLQLDIFQPKNDNSMQRPLIIMVHGGSFIFGKRQDEEHWAKEFASLGYVTSTISYRLGISIKDAIGQQLDKAYSSEAVIMATQDLNAAIRWFKQKTAEENNPFGIDTSHIYLSGSSAGAITANFSQYLVDDNQIPKFVDMSLPELKGEPPFSKNGKYGTRVAGMATYSGAILDTSWMLPNSTPNAIFHGIEDDVVPYGYDTISIGYTPLLPVYGGASMAVRAKNVKSKHCWYNYTQEEGNGHVPHGEIGSGAYLAARAITRNFFGHLVCNVKLECENRDMPNTGTSKPIPADKFMISISNSFIQIRNPSGIKNIRLDAFDIEGRLLLSTWFSGNASIDLPKSNKRLVVAVLRYNLGKKRLILRRLIPVL